MSANAALDGRSISKKVRAKISKRSDASLPRCPSRVVKNDFLLRISLVGLQLRWSPRKNPQRISEDTPPVFSQSPPRFVSTIKMLTTEPFFTTLLVGGKLPVPPFRTKGPGRQPSISRLAMLLTHDLSCLSPKSAEIIHGISTTQRSAPKKTLFVRPGATNHLINLLNPTT